MKNIALTLIASFFINTIFATDLFVDPYLSQGNGTTLFTNIYDAVNAASDGDRIFIVEGYYEEPTLNIVDKSLVLISQNEGGIIQLDANIQINLGQGQTVEIIGFDFGNNYGVETTGQGSNSDNFNTINIIDCQLAYINIDDNYYILNSIKNIVDGSIDFSKGNVVLSSCNTLFVRNNYGYNMSEDDHILIAGNNVSHLININTETFPVMIANNYINHLVFARWNYNSELTNYIRNNNFTEGGNIAFMIEPPAYNIDFSSNIFEAGYAGFLYGSNYSTSYFNWGDDYNCCSYQLYSTSTTAWPQTHISGFFNWTYNGIDLPASNPSGGDPLQFTEIIGSTDIIDAGNPNHEYYDIDLTINDRGVNGGMYSLSNLEPSINLSNGKAFIFDLVMPTDLFQDQNVDVKAKGYHKN
tara:strand:+ start:1323 stop:2558 length:1236 start_codon:yes stop_codon:yes gene_type:complete